MAWMFKPGDVERFTRQFHEKRMREEKFVSGYVQPSPEWILAKCLLCYPVRFADYFYMSKAEYTTLLLSAINETALRRGWDFVVELAKIAREHGMVKDTPLIVAELVPERRQIEEILATYPVKLLLRYAELARKFPHLFRGLDSRKKKALANVLTSMDDAKLEFQAIKYRSAMRDLLNLVHPKPKSEFQNRLFAWVVGRGEPPTDRIRAAEKILRGEVTGSDIALKLAIEYDLPWEIVRSCIGFKHPLTQAIVSSELLESAARKLMSGIDVAMQFRTLAYRLGISTALSILESKKHAVPTSYAAKLITGIYWENPDVAEQIDKMFEERFNEVKNEIFSLINLVEKRRRIVALIDVSYSMSGVRILIVQRILIALRRAIDRAMIFSGTYMPPQGYEIKTLDSIMNLREKVMGTAPLEEAMMYAEREAEKEDAMLLVFTDEMSNVFTRDNIIRAKVPTIVINPTPYPSEHIIKEAGRVVGLGGVDVDSVRAAARILTLNIAQSEKIVDLEKLIQLFRKRIPTLQS